MVKLIQSDTVPARDRIAAAELLAANGFGTPVNRSVHVTLGNGQGNAESVPRDQLEARAAALLTRVEVVSEQ